MRKETRVPMFAYRWIAVLLLLTVAGLSVGAMGEAAPEVEEIFSILEEYKQEPTTFADFDKLATMAYVRGQYDEALGYLDRCIELAGDSPYVLGILYTQKGRIYQEQGQPDQAIAALETAESHSPDNPQMLKLRGEVYMEQKQYGRAVQNLQRLVVLLPEYAEGWRLLGQAQRGNNDGNAKQSQERADTLAQNEANDTLTVAREAALQGDPQGAEAGFTAYLETSDDAGGEVHFQRAKARMLLGQLEEAVGDLQTALTAGYADLAVCYEYLSNCQFALENYAQALAAGEQAIALNSDQVAYDVLYQQMGLSAISLVEMQRAVDYFTRSIERSDALEGNLFYRGLAYMGVEDYPMAVADLTASIDRGELVQRCLYNRGLCHVQTDDTTAAIADLRQALSMQDDPSIATAAENILWQLAMRYVQEDEGKND